MKSTKECKGIALIWLVLLIVAVIAILSVGVYFLVRNINNGNTDSSSISLEGQDQGSSNNVESSKKARIIWKINTISTRNNRGSSYSKNYGTV